MKIVVRNITYYEWEVPEGLQVYIDTEGYTEQDLIDEFFDPDKECVEEVSEPYFEDVGGDTFE